MKTFVLTWERTEEEKLRRHLFGDKGAKFKQGKMARFTPPLISGTITTLVTKDIKLLEIHVDKERLQQGNDGPPEREHPDSP